MLPLLYLAIFFSLSPGKLPAVSLAVPALRQQQQDPKPSPPDKQPSESPQQPAASPAKPADKPKKVITNDDLKGGGGGDGFSAVNFGQINDCDRNCFDQVRQLARVSPGADANWKRDLLQAIDTVRKDDDWQKYLRDLYDVHLKFCRLGGEKRDELAKYADPRNVTPKEIAIDDKYDAKFKQTQAELTNVYARQSALQRRFGENPFAYQFSIVQTNRIQNASCGAHYPVYTPTDPDNQ